jgi:hypothetical protein
VTLGEIDGNVFSGSYDVVLDSQEHVTGSFEPHACAALHMPATTTSTCL